MPLRAPKALFRMTLGPVVELRGPCQEDFGARAATKSPNRGDSGKTNPMASRTPSTVTSGQAPSAGRPAQSVSRWETLSENFVRIVGKEPLIAKRVPDAECARDGAVQVYQASAERRTEHDDLEPSSASASTARSLFTTTTLSAVWPIARSGVRPRSLSRSFQGRGPTLTAGLRLGGPPQTRSQPAVLHKTSASNSKVLRARGSMLFRVSVRVASDRDRQRDESYFTLYRCLPNLFGRRSIAR
jgi:hypothetical protein